LCQISFQFSTLVDFVSPANCHQPESRAVGHPCNPKTDRGHDSILVFVDRLSKMVHIIPTVESLDALKFARHFRNWVLRLHSMPDSVLSDRGPQFNNLF